LKETLETLSKTTFEAQFRQDFQALDAAVQAAVATAIETLATDYLTDPWHHPQVKYIASESEVWRLKVGSRGDPVDHRVFFDITDNGLVFLAVDHRDSAYR